MPEYRYEPFLIEVVDDEMPYEDSPIVEVKPNTDGSGWHVTCASGWSCFIPALPIANLGRELRPAIEPKVGDRLELFGSFGRPIEGMRVDGQTVYWRDAKQREAYRRRYLEDRDAEDRRAFTLLAGEQDAEFDALPPFFRARIERFRDESPDFRKDSERYEMFCCTEAVKIAEHLRPTLPADADADAITAAVRAWHELPFEQQKDVIDGGHSGNTFGGACSLAAAYLRHLAGEPVSV